MSTNKINIEADNERQKCKCVCHDRVGESWHDERCCDEMNGQIDGTTRGGTLVTNIEEQGKGVNYALKVSEAIAQHGSNIEEQTEPIETVLIDKFEYSIPAPLHSKQIEAIEKALTTYAEKKVLEREEQIKINLNFMRQWLNEERITDKKMVTSEELHHWALDTTFWDVDNLKT